MHPMDDTNTPEGNRMSPPRALDAFYSDTCTDSED